MAVTRLSLLLRMVQRSYSVARVAASAIGRGVFQSRIDK
jgi:hypothetical protein